MDQGAGVQRGHGLTMSRYPRPVLTFDPEALLEIGRKVYWDRVAIPIVLILDPATGQEYRPRPDEPVNWRQEGF